MYGAHSFDNPDHFAVRSGSRVAVQQKLGLRTERRTKPAGSDRDRSPALAGVRTEDAFSRSEDSNRPQRGGISVSFSMTVERRSNDYSRILCATAQGGDAALSRDVAGAA